MTVLKLKTKYGVDIWINPMQICVVTRGVHDGEAFVWASQGSDGGPMEFAMSVEEFFSLIPGTTIVRRP